MTRRIALQQLSNIDSNAVSIAHDDDVTAAFFFEYVFLSIGCMFGLSNGDNVAIVLVDIKQQVHRLVAHGSRLSTNAKPIGTRLGLIYCPLSD